MLQIANPLRKSALWPPNISDEHVSCIAPATRMHFPEPLQMSHDCQRFWNCYKTITFFAHFWQSAESLVPATQNRIWTFKSGSSMRCFLNILPWKCASRDNGVHFFDIATSKGAPGMVCFVHFDFEMFFAPQGRAVFHLLSGQMAPHPPL